MCKTLIATFVEPFCSETSREYVISFTPKQNKNNTHFKVEVILSLGGQIKTKQKLKPNKQNHQGSNTEQLVCVVMSRPGVRI